MKHLRSIRNFLLEGADVFSEKTRKILSKADSLLIDSENIGELETGLRKLFDEEKVEKEEADYLLDYLKKEWTRKNG